MIAEFLSHGCNLRGRVCPYRTCYHEAVAGEEGGRSGEGIEVGECAVGADAFGGEAFAVGVEGVLLGEGAVAVGESTRPTTSTFVVHKSCPLRIKALSDHREFTERKGAMRPHQDEPSQETYHLPDQGSHE